MNANISENLFCIATDSACDLPADFIAQHNIRILPIYLKFGNEVFTDIRDPQKTVDFYREGRLEKNIDAESYPVSTMEMSKILEDELVLRFEKVLAVTISSTRSQVYRNIRDAVFISQPKFKELRENNGLSRNFRIQVVDSKSLFTGQGVLVHEAVRLLREESVCTELAMVKLESLRDRVRAFILPDDLYHLKNRASTKGDNSVGWLSYQVGNLLNVKPIIQAYRGETAPVDKAVGFENGLKKVFGYATDAINKGLGANVIVMSYSGHLSGIEKERTYQDFISFSASRGVPTLLSVMSTTAAINVGPGCFSLAFAE